MNGVDGDVDGDGYGFEVHGLADPAITRRQEAYVRQVVDAVNDLDNVLYEVANEDGRGTLAWQYHMVAVVKAYEAGKPTQHPVGLVAQYPRDDAGLADPRAGDWVSPAADHLDPPASDGSRPVILDTDHGAERFDDPQIPWKHLTRGYHSLVYDQGLAEAPDDARWTPIRQAMGDARRLAGRLDLAATAPRGDLASTGYALAAPGTAYLVFQPAAGAFTVRLEAGTYAAAWFDPTRRATAAGAAVGTAGGPTAFTPPSGGPAVLLLTRPAPGPVAARVPVRLRVVAR